MTCMELNVLRDLRGAGHAALPDCDELVAWPEKKRTFLLHNLPGNLKLNGDLEQACTEF